MAFATTTELAQLVEKELGHNLTSSSSQRTDIVSHLDRANKIVHAGGGLLNATDDGRRSRDEIVFSFARSPTPLVLTLRPAITTPTVTVTREATTLTFDAAPDGVNSVTGYYIRINGEDEVYRISAHTAAATTATIDGGYVGPSDASAATCAIFKLQYELGSNTIAQLISPINVFSKNRSQKHISVVDKDELQKQYPLSNIYQEFPSMAAVVKELAGTVTLQFNSYPSDLERIEVDYVATPTTLDTSTSNPVLPEPYRPALAYLAAYFISSRNNDSRAQELLKMAKEMFAELVLWNERLMSSGDSDFGRIVIQGFNNKPLIGVQTDYTIAG